MNRVAFAVLCVAVVDLAIETFAAGSPVRWWVVAIALMYGAFTAVRWRQSTWGGKAAVSGVCVLSACALTSWLPRGLDDGLRAASVSTSTILTLAAAAGILLASLAIWRSTRAPLVIRAAVVLTALSAMVSLAVALWRGEPFATLFTSGHVGRAAPLLLLGVTLGAFLVLPLGLIAVVSRMGVRLPAAGAGRAFYEAAAMALVLVTVAAAAAPVFTTKGKSDRSEVKASSRLLAPPSQVDRGLRALEDARRGAHRDRWDPAYVAHRLGPNPWDQFAWVRSNTFWVPYLGILRGPVGVLMDRQGNSLDRSLLLAALLRETGHVVRLARRPLTREEAAAALAYAAVAAPLVAADEQAAQPGNAQKLAGDYQLASESVARTLGDAAEGLLSAYAEIRRRVPNQTARLLALVPRPEPGAELQRRLRAAMAAMQDHWWVQVQSGDAWTDLDLMEDDGAVEGIVPAETVDPETMPASLYHDVVVRVVAEQRAGSVARHHVLLEQAFRPLDVVGKSITLQFLPLRWPMDNPPADQTAFESTLLSQKEWAAVLYTGDDIAAQGGVDAHGDVLSMVANPMAGLGSGMASVFGRAESSEVGELRAVSIEYDIRSPGAPARTIQRPVFDVSDNRAALNPNERLKRALALMTRTEILPLGWEPAPDYVFDRAAASLLANRARLLEAASVESAEASASAPLPAKPEASSPSPLLMLALARFEWSRVGGSVFYDRPNIVARHVQIVRGDKSYGMQTLTDIVANDVGVDVTAPDGFAVRVEQGVMDTNVESLLQFGAATSGNTADAFARGGAWLTLRRGDNPAARVGLQGIARRTASRDLDGDAMLVIPARAVDAAATWWRVDGQTGTTLGIGADGHGSALSFLLAFQSSGETSVHYNLLHTMAEGWLYQEAFCRAIPIPFIAVRQGWRLYLRDVAGPGLRDRIDPLVRGMGPERELLDDIKHSGTAATRLCIFATMAAGVLVTLPLVLMSVRFAMLGRVAAFAAEEGPNAARAAAEAGGGGPAWRFGKGPARGATPTAEPPPPIEIPPGTRIEPKPEKCNPPPEFGRGRRDDGFGSYPPNSPTSEFDVQPYPRLKTKNYSPGPPTAAQEAADLEALKADIPVKQQKFDEALGKYRDAAQRVEALKSESGIPAGDPWMAEKAAEDGLNKARWDLIKAKQRLALYEDMAPPAEDLRNAQAEAEAAANAFEIYGSEAYDRYRKALGRLREAREAFYKNRKLSDYPADATPSAPPGGSPPADAPPTGGECGGTGSSGPGGSGDAASQSGGSAPNMSGTQDLGTTQPDMGTTMPGGRPGPVYAPVRGGPPDPQAPLKALVGVGGMLGG